MESLNEYDFCRFMNRNNCHFLLCLQLPVIFQIKSSMSRKGYPVSEFDEQMKRVVEGAASDELLQSLLLIPAPLYSLPSITHSVIPGKLEWSDRILAYGYGFKSVLSSPYIVTGILDNNLSSTQYHFSVYVYQSIHYIFFFRDGSKQHRMA